MVQQGFQKVTRIVIITEKTAMLCIYKDVDFREVQYFVLNLMKFMRSANPSTVPYLKSIFDSN